MARLAATFIILILWLPHVYGEGKIGYINLKEALHGVKDGQAAESKVKKVFEEKQLELAQRESELETFRQSIEAEFDKLPSSEKWSRWQEYQKRHAKLQEDRAQYQKELNKLEDTLYGPILKRLEELIAELGKKEGYEMIFDKLESSILYAPQELDKTKALIELYESRYSK